MKRIAGIWDLARSGGSVGTLLILLEELEIQRRIHRSDVSDVVIVGDAKYLLSGASPGRVDVGGRCISGVARLGPLVTVIRAMSSVADCHICSDEVAIRAAVKLIATNCVSWPDPETLIRGRHSYDSTRAIQDYFNRTGEIPRLSVSGTLMAWTKSYLKEKSGGRFPIAVHLKSNAAVSGQSNANVDSWLTFISECQRQFEVHFVLVGDDPMSARFRDLPNVTIAQDDRLTLDRHLAVIQVAGLFMGMMSGPANMALFGKNPYLIFKNPDHHASEMALELGNNDHYPFALAHQRVLRMWDTTENLTAAFESAIRQVATK